MATTPLNFSDTQKSALVQQIMTGGLSPQQACTEYNLSTEQLKDWVRLFRRAVQQAFDQELQSSLSGKGLEVDDLARAEFSGSLAQLGVADLLETIHMGRKDARITVTHGSEASEIWCRRGDVVDARSGSLVGEPAVYRVLTLDRGCVVADFSPVARERRIRLSTPRLLLKAASTNGLRARLMQRLGDPRQVFIAAPEAMRKITPRLQADELAVLSLFDGVRSIEEVVFLSGLPDARALEIVARFRDRKVLLRSAPPGAAMAATAPVTLREQAAWAWAAHPPTWLLASGAVLSSALGALTVVAALGLLGPSEAAPPASSALSPPGPERGAPPASSALSPPGPERGAPVLLAPAPTTPSVAPSRRCPEGMVWIGPGEFTMGTESRRAALSLARPAHRVRVDGFCIGVHEVTMERYGACVAEGQCSPAHSRAHFAAEALEGVASSEALELQGAMCNAGQPGREQHPVNCVSHAQAAAYCGARGGRLPTEAEWEFAARGPLTREFPWGDDRPTRAHVNACGKECRRWHARRGAHGRVHRLMYASDDGFAGTAPVGSFPRGASRDGVMDLIGNVFEWTADGMYDYEPDPSDNPRGPSDSDSFVIRGGNFNSGLAEFASPALRFAMHRDSYSHGVGFRCAADAAPTLSSGASSAAPPSSASPADPAEPELGPADPLRQRARRPGP